MSKIEVTYCISKFAELVLLVGKKHLVHGLIMGHTSDVRSKANPNPYLELDTYIPDSGKVRTVRFLNDPPFFAILGESEEVDMEKPVVDESVAHVSL
jgi:hypothetical protein